MSRQAKVVELPLSPGALSDDTELAAKLHAVSMDKMRSRGARWETFRGWEEAETDGMTDGVARGVHTYADLHGNAVKVAASESAINAWLDGTRYDITPKWKDVWLGTGAITAGSTTTSAVVTWNIYTPATDTTASAAAHDLRVGDMVTFSCLINEDSGAEQLNGTHIIQSVPSPTTFTITVANTANIQVDLPFVCTVTFREGLVTGTGNSVAERPRVWSIDNYGENAVMCGSGTPIWYWQPEIDGYSNLLTNSSFTTTLSGWTAGTGWAANSGNALHTGDVASDLSQSVAGILEGGRTYECSFELVTFQSNVTAVRIKVAGIDIFPRIEGAAGVALALQTYTFRFVCPANPTTVTITADSSHATDNDEFAIDNFTIRLLEIAHPISEAPQKNYAIFVDGNHILNALGTVEADGDFNPLLYRWSAQDNFRDWIPDTDNIAGELTLGRGSYAVTGGQVGERNLLLTDDGAYVASFTTQGYAVQNIAGGCGAIGARAMAIHNTRAFWASHKGFYVYDGAQVLPVSCPVKDQYVGQLAEFQENKTFAWINTEFGEVFFHYPHTDDGTETSRYLTYNFLEESNPWTIGTFDRTCFTRASVFQNPLGIDADGTLWFHETGTSMPGDDIVLPFIETGYVTAQDGDRWLGCRRYYPDIERQVGNILFTVTGKRAPQGQNNTQTVGPFVIPVGKRTVDFLLGGRQLKFRWESDTSTTQWRLGVVGLEMITDRERR